MAIGLKYICGTLDHEIFCGYDSLLINQMFHTRNFISVGKSSIKYRYDDTGPDIAFLMHGWNPQNLILEIICIRLLGFESERCRNSRGFLLPIQFLGIISPSHQLSALYKR